MSTPPIRKGLPWLHDNQIKKIVSYLKPSDMMLEYGSGGSTVYFSKFVKKYYSIESDRRWFEKQMKLEENTTSICIEPNYQGKRDPGCKNSDIPQEEFERLQKEYPFANSWAVRRYWQFKDYVDAVKSFSVLYFDKVFIDGRARSFCAFRVLDYIDEKSVVFIDNFFDRPNYSDILNVYEIMDKVDVLAILRKKDG